MRCHRLAVGLGFCLLVGTALCALWVYVENWLPVSYIPYYLPCPEIFNMKLQYKGEKPFQPVAQSQYPQPKLLEQRRTELLTLTPWLAPIVSEGTFNPELLRHIYQPLNLTIGLTAFAVGNTSWSRLSGSSCMVTGYAITSSPTIPQPFPGSRWPPAASSASSPSRGTPAGRRSPRAGWRPSASTLPRGRTGKWTTSSASMWTWCSGTRGALRPWETWWLPFTHATMLSPASSSPTSAGMFPPPSWQTVRGTSIMVGQSLGGGWPGCMSLPGAATWPSWQTRPTASWQPGRRRAT
ncbi:PREDICTED: globoside alpha-1,3-N-acetylgalactosaminyltransferase 1 isoform X3 [Ceratotherium simum simum]|uniref:Globoside alpha-1,3-N-acetylgalactosaminyltransferase 1 isoform X3 n=1 Tax=Ceratotherium simum simum TaxID=73337 RepID=A0ABM1CDZ9_CERSS|nr:PREDICTED: globoside alpha-1,3-N-acetylgalactosaminyltransferase 1 isoform X3 [Ceratotherium simum simum]